MTTKEHEANKICVFCASEYHLEMILLPYIKENMDESEFIIFTERDMQKTLEKVIEKTNLKKQDKERIKNINWKNDENLKMEKIMNVKSKLATIIINGSFKYIKRINKKIENLEKNTYKIIDCYYVSDPEVDIDKIRKNYKYILNTQKL